MRTFLAFLILSVSPTLLCADENSLDPDFGDGFVSMQGGTVHIFGSEQYLVTDPALAYVQIGLNFLHEFGVQDASDALISIFKVGGGYGKERTTYKAALFYDLLLKLRYTMFSRGTLLRPFIDFGPGLITYVNGAFELEGGGGLNVYFGSGFAGAGVQFKQLFASDSFKQGLGYFGELGYQF